MTESDYKDDPLVSGSIDAIKIPLELSIVGTGKKIMLAALLDSGCTHCLISPKLVGKMGESLRRLKTPIVFCQLDGYVAGAILANFATKSLNLLMGSHSKTLVFIMTPGIEWPLVLGLTWLKKRNPIVDWREGCLKFTKKSAPPLFKDESGRCESHCKLASTLSEQEL